jgi:hypothetical protein
MESCISNGIVYQIQIQNFNSYFIFYLFIYGLLFIIYAIMLSTAEIKKCHMTDWLMSNELKWTEEWLWHNLGTILAGLRKTTKNINQVNQSLGEDFKLWTPVYEARVLTTRMRHSLSFLLLFTF